MRGRHLAALLLSLTAPAAAAAQESGDCSTFKWSIAREQAAFAAADLPALKPGAPFPGLGRAATVTLAPQGEVAYTVKPRKPPKSTPAYGAELALPDGPGGDVEVTLSGDGWIDVVQGGKVLRSTAFSGRTGCPGIRKSVRFTLAPGPAAIAISDTPDATLKMAVMPVN